jgi:cysteine sulfinate desulfinase/cysteine desulfurase-like protein
MREGGIVLIYADNAATTKLDDEAFEAMIPWLRDNYGNPSVFGNQKFQSMAV